MKIIIFVKSKMPYARRYKRRNFRPRRYGKSAYARKVLPKQRKTNKTVLRTQGYRQLKLTRKVNFLMKARWGSEQISYQTTRVSPLVTNGTPILWDMDDYTCLRTAPNPAGGTLQMKGCQIWTVNSAGTGIIQNPQAADGFVTSPGLAGIYWDDTSRSLCGDTGFYKPVYCDYILEFDAPDGIANTTIRVDFIKQKRTVQAQPVDVPQLSTSSVRMLPEGLVGLTDLASNRNHINPAFFKVIKTKWLMINDTGTGPASTGTTAGRKFYKFRIWGKGVKRQLREAPGIPGSIEDTQASLQYNRSSRFGYTNSDAMRGYYCLVSTTDRLSGSTLNVKITRMCKWRDPVGSYKL